MKYFKDFRKQLPEATDQENDGASGSAPLGNPADDPDDSPKKVTKNNSGKDGNVEDLMVKFHKDVPPPTGAAPGMAPPPQDPTKKAPPMKESNIQEISRKTLGSYIKRSAGDSERYGQAAMDHDKLAREYSRKAHKLSTRPRYQKKADQESKISIDLDRVAGNRIQGLHRAVDKLTQDAPRKKGESRERVKVLAKESILDIANRKLRNSKNK